MNGRHARSASVRAKPNGGKLSIKRYLRVRSHRLLPSPAERAAWKQPTKRERTQRKERTRRRKTEERTRAKTRSGPSRHQDRTTGPAPEQQEFSLEHKASLWNWAIRTMPILQSHCAVRMSFTYRLSTRLLTKCLSWDVLLPEICYMTWVVATDALSSGLPRSTAAAQSDSILTLSGSRSPGRMSNEMG